MFERIPTCTLCLYYAFLDVYSGHFYNFDDMKKNLFLEILERSEKNERKKNGFNSKTS